ncbi:MULTISPECIES: hypothetical protein [Acinetobacter]|nr:MULTISPECIES: hypothetical protein [Acinetobacter]MBJ8464399.1 hypothetical protein [Acinetobacter nosocomialis]MBP1487281.1 hypothetical protein [Acinetobacter nosocomialis]MBP1497820.1 hypothetical protein [Acinetobacter nosocomialis]MBR7691068.1 hypothetical protein [Acinetobacter nosocomialis]MBR7727972.1 hypothetical protein [Acinetobacter nosocomialis]
MPERLELTKNVQFYKMNNCLDESVISDILNEATSNQEQDSDFILEAFRDIKITTENIEYKLTAKVFPTTRQVHFLNDDKIEDRIFAFIILVELDDYLVVMSKSCANFSQILKDKFELIQTQDLSKLLGNNAEFQKMAFRNMTVSDKAVRSRSYEAFNLKGTFSTHAAGRSIPSHIKVRDSGKIKSISGTGRLVESSARQSIDDIVNWANFQIQMLTTADQNDFLTLFARKIQLKEVLEISQPSALLIDIYPITDGILDDTLKIKYEHVRKEIVNGKKTKVKKIVDIPDRFKDKLILELEKVYEIDTDWNIVGLESSKIRKNKHTLSISTNLLKKIKIEENNKVENFIAYINRKGLFSITFFDPKYMYFMDNCFEDKSGISEIDSILEILEPQKDIEKVISEKGSFTTSHTAFDTDSMFGFVENICTNQNYIFCDDLGDEWADHITFNLTDLSISFIHSKHGDISTSASNLHDVVGQGIKNLGNMFFSKDQIMKKLTNSLINKKYKSGKGIQTQIDRVRKPVLNFESDIDLLLKSHKLHRNCILSCSFISKSDVVTEFNKLKNGQSVRGNIVQLLWILSSFSHAAKEANVIPIIYCAA